MSKGSELRWPTGPELYHRAQYDRDYLDEVWRQGQDGEFVAWVKQYGDAIMRVAAIDVDYWELLKDDLPQMYGIILGVVTVEERAGLEEHIERGEAAVIHYRQAGRSLVLLHENLLMVESRSKSPVTLLNVPVRSSWGWSTLAEGTSGLLSPTAFYNRGSSMEIAPYRVNLCRVYGQDAVLEQIIELLAPFVAQDKARRESDFTDVTGEEYSRALSLIEEIAEHLGQSASDAFLAGREEVATILRDELVWLEQVLQREEWRERRRAAE
jgi:hypothetical protein